MHTSDNLVANKVKWHSKKKNVSSSPEKSAQLPINLLVSLQFIEKCNNTDDLKLIKKKIEQKISILEKPFLL